MLSAYGKKEWLSTAAAAAAASAFVIYLGSVYGTVAGYVLAIVFLFSWTALALFFRDPERKTPEDDSLMVSPADGVVRDIGTCDPGRTGGAMRRIGIFLSVLDVHINRAPCDIEVLSAEYREGEFHDARSPKASAENESNTVVCTGKSGSDEFPVIVKQISGAIARRIVSEALPGTSFRRGQRFGMIKFGSRTELYFPDRPGFEILVKEGGRVYAGLTPVVRIKQQQNNS